MKQRILSYHMTPMTQAIWSSVVIVQTSAECCLEPTHMGYRMLGGGGLTLGDIQKVPTPSKSLYSGKTPKFPCIVQKCGHVGWGCGRSDSTGSGVHCGQRSLLMWAGTGGSHWALLGQAPSWSLD